MILAETTPLSHHFAVWMAGLLGMEANWLFHASKPAEVLPH